MFPVLWLHLMHILVLAIRGLVLGDVIVMNHDWLSWAWRAGCLSNFGGQLVCRFRSHGFIYGLLQREFLFSE